MKIKLLENNQIEFLKEALHVFEKQHKAIAVNVANANNPGFRRLKTDFSELLNTTEGQGKLLVTDVRHIKSTKNNVNGEDLQENNKSVDLLEEMTLLAENQIRHEFTTRFLRQKYDNLKQAITGKIT